MQVVDLVISACLSCFLPRKDQPQRYLYCLDLLLNKVPLDAIDAWFDLFFCLSSPKPWVPNQYPYFLVGCWKSTSERSHITNRHLWVDDDFPAESQFGGILVKFLAKRTAIRSPLSLGESRRLTFAHLPNQGPKKIFASHSNWRRKGVKKRWCLCVFFCKKASVFCSKLKYFDQQIWKCFSQRFSPKGE